jgi:ADP-ribose pyrophosphatase
MKRSGVAVHLHRLPSMFPVIGSRVVYDGKWRVRVDTLDLGPEGTLEKAYVQHPGAVVIVPLLEAEDSAAQVLMLVQYRHALRQSILELPAGTREGDEPWAVCAQRELREETGYAVGELVSLGEVWAAPGVSDERMAIFLARGLRHAPLSGDADEQIVVEPRPLADLVAMALDGALDDAKSVVAVLRAAHFLDPAAGVKLTR